MDVYPSLPSFQRGVSITALGFLLYALARVIYNVFFHPLSRFPGPRGAACTRWWLAYMELGRGVSLSTIRAELHQKYGTRSSCHSFVCRIDAGQGDIIRIAPNEVNGTSHLASRDLTAAFSCSSTLQDQQCTMRYTIPIINGIRIMNITGASTWTNPSLRRRITENRSTAGRWSPICFPEERFQRYSTLFGAKYELYPVYVC